ncbi:hypothetical protein BTVI_16940 [Pitangus sulphuratus]|nr:hypothetical protein BTVI_16940 [Pitangus sulphuratus]
MSCRVLRAYPTRVLTYEWRLGGKLLRTGQFDLQDSTDYTVGSLARDSYGLYNCNIINEAEQGLALQLRGCWEGQQRGAERVLQCSGTGGIEIQERRIMGLFMLEKTSKIN